MTEPMMPDAMRQLLIEVFEFEEHQDVPSLLISDDYGFCEVYVSWHSGAWRAFARSEQCTSDTLAEAARLMVEVSYEL